MHFWRSNGVNVSKNAKVRLLCVSFLYGVCVFISLVGMNDVMKRICFLALMFLPSAMFLHGILNPIEVKGIACCPCSYPVALRDSASTHSFVTQFASFHSPPPLPIPCPSLISLPLPLPLLSQRRRKRSGSTPTPTWVSLRQDVAGRGRVPRGRQMRYLRLPLEEKVGDEGVWQRERGWGKGSVREVLSAGVR